MRPREQWVVITQAGCPEPEPKRKRRWQQPEKSVAELGAGSPPPTWGMRAGAVAMATAGTPWMWTLGALITALILGVTEPALANDVASCNSPAAPSSSSASTQALGTGAAEDTRENDGSGSRIINGSDCPPHAQPWQAALMLQHNQLYCGAVLVAPWWLLTAAHCRKRIVRVRLGHHSQSPVYKSGQQLFQGIKTIPHPGYSHPRHANDLMLIKLNRRIRETQDVKPINISSQCPPAGTSCLVSGWGTTSSPQENFPRELQCLNITVLSTDKCKEAYPGQIDATMFCAGDQAGRDSCQGDSGGPVVCNNTLQGLVSWGDFPCAKPNRPGVYTNLCRFTKWIHDTIQSNS